MACISLQCAQFMPLRKNTTWPHDGGDCQPIAFALRGVILFTVRFPLERIKDNTRRSRTGMRRARRGGVRRRQRMSPRTGDFLLDSSQSLRLWCAGLLRRCRSRRGPFEFRAAPQKRMKFAARLHLPPEMLRKLHHLASRFRTKNTNLRT